MAEKYDKKKVAKKIGRSVKRMATKDYKDLKPGEAAVKGAVTTGAVGALTGGILGGKDGAKLLGAIGAVAGGVKGHKIAKEARAERLKTVKAVRERLAKRAAAKKRRK